MQHIRPAVTFMLIVPLYIIIFIKMYLAIKDEPDGFQDYSSLENIGLNLWDLSNKFVPQSAYLESIWSPTCGMNLSAAVSKEGDKNFSCCS